jgi:hypothetical protein
MIDELFFDEWEKRAGGDNNKAGRCGERKILSALPTKWYISESIAPQVTRFAIA